MIVIASSEMIKIIIFRCIFIYRFYYGIFIYNFYKSKEIFITFVIVKIVIDFVFIIFIYYNFFLFLYTRLPPPKYSLFRASLRRYQLLNTLTRLLPFLMLCLNSQLLLKVIKLILVLKCFSLHLQFKVFELIIF